MTSPVVDSYLDELLADLPALAPGEQAAAGHAASQAATRTAPDSPAPEASSPAPAAPPARSAPAPAAAPSTAPQSDAPRPPPAPRAEPRVVAEPATAIQRPSLPATQRWLRIALGRDHYAFELLRVQEVVRMAPIVAMRGADRAVLGVMNLRGRIVPVFDLGRWLGGADVEVGERARIVVVERNDELIGVLVADVEDVASLAREHIEPPLPGSTAGGLDNVIVGVARVGNAPTVLLDANTLFQ